VESVDWGTKHVVVVDDDRDTLALYRDVLGEESYRATLLASPDLEPAAVAALAPDLLLLDLRFGHERRGVDLLRRLKGNPDTLAIPVLVCSADARLLDELHEELAAWDCAVLAKPFGLDDLLAAIAGCLVGQPSPHPAPVSLRAHSLSVDRLRRRAAAAPLSDGGSSAACAAGHRPESALLAAPRGGPEVPRPGPARPGAGAHPAGALHRRDSDGQ